MRDYSLQCWECCLFGLVLGALFWWVVGCSSPLPPIEPQTDVVKACEPSRVVLLHFGCSEGESPTYVADCEHIAKLGYLWTNDSSGPLCILGAETKAEVQACNVVCE